MLCVLRSVSLSACWLLPVAREWPGVCCLLHVARCVCRSTPDCMSFVALIENSGLKSVCCCQSEMLCGMGFTTKQALKELSPVPSQNSNISFLSMADFAAELTMRWFTAGTSLGMRCARRAATSSARRIGFSTTPTMYANAAVPCVLWRRRSLQRLSPSRRQHICKRRSRSSRNRAIACRVPSCGFPL